MIRIRKSTPSDLDALMELYEAARQFMRTSGNPSQWVNGYPSRELVSADIDAEISYVGIDTDGEIAMVFTFFIGADPAYATIHGGQWLNTNPYGTIHRLASSGRHPGMLRRCVDFCQTLIADIRLDTHADNLPMQHAATRLGFHHCGTIHCHDGSPRLAYHLPKDARSQSAY